MTNREKFWVTVVIGVPGTGREPPIGADVAAATGWKKGPPTPVLTAEAGGDQGEGVTVVLKGGGCTVAAAAAPVGCVRASLDDVVVRPPDATFEYVPRWSWI